METDQTESKNKKVLVGIIIALLLVVTVTLYFLYSGNKDNTDLTAQKSALDSTFRNLSDTLDMRRADIEQLTNHNVKLDSTIAASQLMIQNEKKQISGLLAKNKMTKADLDEAKGMIAQYETSISDLQKKGSGVNGAKSATDAGQSKTFDGSGFGASNYKCAKRTEQRLIKTSRNWFVATTDRSRCKRCKTKGKWQGDHSKKCKSRREPPYQFPNRSK